MTKRSTTFGLESTKVSDLLRVGSDSESHNREVDTNQRKADLLQDLLAKRLPTDSQLMNEWQSGLEHVYQTMYSLLGEPIRNLLLQSTTSLIVLRKIKEYGARASQGNQAEPERQVGKVVYFAAIASALRFYSNKITEFTYEQLAQSFLTLSKLTWLPHPFKDHFIEATHLCNKKVGRKTNGTVSNE